MTDNDRIGRILKAAYPDVGSDDPVSYLEEETEAFRALDLSFLFWPRFINVYGAVFLALDGDDEKFIVERLTTPHPVRKSHTPDTSWVDAVDSFNWIELSQLFHNIRNPAEFLTEAHLEVGKILCQTWSAKLRQEYPDRGFSVCIAEADESVEQRIEIKQLDPQLQTPDGWNPERHIIETRGGS